MARKSKQDWLATGLKLLAENGHTDLTIDALATRLDVTKGSFYHHFKNQGDFKAQLLDFWLQEITEQIIVGAEYAGSTGEILDRIIEQVALYGFDPEPALRAWAQEDETVRDAVARVDQRRLEYVRDLFQRDTGDADRAHTMSQLLYTMIVGADYLQPSLSHADRWRLHQEFKRIYSLDNQRGEDDEQT